MTTRLAFHEAAAERTSGAGNKDTLAVEIGVAVFEFTHDHV